MPDQYEEATLAYQRALPAGEMMEFATTPLDRLGIPARTATFFARDGRTRGGLGYGLTDAQALVGALGEMIEEFAASRAVLERPRERGSYREMSTRYGVRGVADPRTLCLDAGGPYIPDMPLEWFPTVRLAAEETVWVPVEFVATYKGDLGPDAGPPLVLPITNGPGAGLAPPQALAHGRLELRERAGHRGHKPALATGAALDPATITDPVSRTLLDRLDAAGIDVIVKVASTDFGIPNFYVVGMDRDGASGGQPVMAAAGGEAAHPVAAVALRKALLEFTAARPRLAFFHGPLEDVAQIAPPGYLDRLRADFNPQGLEARGLEAMRGWLALDLAGMHALLSPRVLSVDQWVDFSALPTAPEALANDRESLLSWLTGRLAAENLDILVADFSDPADGIYAVKVIVPGLEVETMSYGRIGERNVRRLMLADAGLADAGLAGVGLAPEGAAPIALTPQAEERLGGPAWLDRAAVARAVGDLYPLYREPGRHAVRLAA